MSDSILLNGFAFSGYRSFGDKIAKMAPLRKINFIIGQNNSGKSNIINFLAHQYPNFASRVNNPSGNRILDDIDKPLYTPPPRARIGVPLAKDNIDEYIESLVRTGRQGVAGIARKIICALTDDDEEFYWFIYGANEPVEKPISAWRYCRAFESGFLCS